MNTTTSTKGHPKGLYLLYFTEMWERFSYYGMRAIFVLYMVNGLLFDKEMASKIYGSYTGLVYLTPLLGGYIADRFWGNRKSIIFGGLLMAIGQFFMFMSGSAYEEAESASLLMYSGLGFLILGNGFFKPNISTMVGSLYEPNDRRVDSAFTIFYQGINMGALLAPTICGGLGERYDASGIILPAAFKWGFLAACVGMVISLIAFVLLKNQYLTTPKGDQVGLAPAKVKIEVEKGNQAGISAKTLGIGILALAGLFSLFNFQLDFDLIGSIIFSVCLVLPAIIISDSSLTKIEKDRIYVIYIIAFFVIFFWSAFEQAGASLTFFAQEQTDRNIFGWNMPASMFQSFNALFIVILAPVAVAVWSALGARGKEPASPVKQAMGLAFLALGYLFIAWGVDGIQPWDKVSMAWLVGLYLIHTIGELCLSPIGLSMVVKLAPARFVSLLMGVWFLSTATANKFAGDLSALYPEEVKNTQSANLSDEQLSQFEKSYALDTNVWKLSLKDSTKLPTASINIVKSDAKDKKAAHKLESLVPKDAASSTSYYQIYLIKLMNPDVNTLVASEDGRYAYAVKKKKVKVDGVSSVKNTIEVYDLKPERPKFLGMSINNLYDFFMIFVYMAGASAILLFAIHKGLLRMMHGIK